MSKQESGPEEKVDRYLEAHNGAEPNPDKARLMAEASNAEELKIASAREMAYDAIRDEDESGVYGADKVPTGNVIKEQFNLATEARVEADRNSDTAASNFDRFNKL